MIARTAWMAFLLSVLVTSTLGEGGAHPTSQLVQHVILMTALVPLLVTRPSALRLDPGVAAAWGAFVLAAAAGAVFAPYAFAAWLVLVEIVAFTLVLAVAARTGTSSLGPLAAGLTAWAALQSIAGLVQVLAGGLARPSAGFLNPNHFAAWLVAAAFLGAGWALGRGRAVRAAFGLAMIPVTATLALAGSRGALVGIAAGALVAGWLLRGRMTRTMRRWGIVALLLVATLGTAGILWRFRAGDPDGWARPSIWKASLVAAAGRPLTGTGPGQFETESSALNFPRDDRPLRYERGFSGPHSDLVRAVAEFGVPAALALAVALVLGLRVIARRRIDAGLSPVEVGALGAWAALAAQAAFNDLTETPALYLLAAALGGALVSRPRGSGSGSVASPPSWVRASAVLLALVIFAAGDVAPYLSWRIARALPRIGLSEAGRTALARAIRRNPFQPDLYLRRVQDRLAAPEALDPATYATLREDAETAIRLNPKAAVGFTALAHVEGAGCLGVFGDVPTRERARSAFEEAERRSPFDPFLPLDAARFLLAAGDPGGARRAAERALRLEPRAVSPRLTLAKALLAEGGPEATAAARARLDEAEDLARRFADLPRESLYVKGLMDLDRAELARLRAVALDAPVGRN